MTLYAFRSLRSEAGSVVQLGWDWSEVVGGAAIR